MRARGRRLSTTITTDVDVDVDLDESEMNELGWYYHGEHAAALNADTLRTLASAIVREHANHPPTGLAMCSTGVCAHLDFETAHLIQQEALPHV